MKAAFLDVGRAREPWSEMTAMQEELGNRATASVLKDASFSILQAFGESKPSSGEQG